MDDAYAQEMAQAADRAVVAPPGRLVPAGDGHLYLHLHVHCEGHAGPTVLLEAEVAASGFAQTRAWVQCDLAHEGRVCVHDRAGLGWSDSTQQVHDGVSKLAGSRPR